MRTAPFDVEGSVEEEYEDWCAQRDLDPADDHRVEFELDQADALSLHLEALAEARAGL